MDPREGLPPERGDDLLSSIRRLADQSGRCVVVLDDDPTGTQTVHNVPVLTRWDTPILVEEFSSGTRLFFLLTNSRALLESQAVALGREIGEQLAAASVQSEREFSVISRSDSTLRGHFPCEVDSLADAIGVPDAVRVVMPFFLQGGRLTIGDVHYVADGEQLIPAAETPFANDATFGFESSNLRDWVAEKSGRLLSKMEIHSLSLNDLRTAQPQALARRIAGLPPRSTLIVNAAATSDAQAFALAARLAERDGAKLLYRTAAGFVQAFAGIPDRPLLEPDEMLARGDGAGLIVVGSYVPKTTQQLERLHREETNLVSFMLDVPAMLDDRRGEHLTQTADAISSALNEGRDVLLHTSRGLITGADADSSLRVGTQVSAGIVEVVRSLTAPLRFLIAKGGITSSDIATKALEAKRADVLGQVLPGIPVWRLGAESRRPHLPYIVFPGNVGDEDALATVYAKLRSR